MGRTAVTVATGDENPISDDASKREAGLNRLKRAIDVCKVVGSSLLCGPIHSALGEFSDSGPTESEWNNGKSTLSAAADYAGENGVTLVLEYLNRFECYFLNTAADTSRFVQEVNHPHLKMI